MGLVHLYQYECGLLKSTNSSLLEFSRKRILSFRIYFVVIFVMLFVLVSACTSERFMRKRSAQCLTGQLENNSFCMKKFPLLNEAPCLELQVCNKFLYIEVLPFQNKNSKTVVILIFIWVSLCLSTKYSCH